MNAGNFMIETQEEFDDDPTFFYSDEDFFGDEPEDELTEEEIRDYDDHCEEFEENRRRKIAESLEY